MNGIQSFQQRLYKAFKLGLSVSLLALSGLSFHAATLNAASGHHCESDSELGLKLENRFWNSVKNQNIWELSEQLAPNFQGLNISGIYSKSKEEQVRGLTGVTLSSFTIHQPHATRDGDILVFSYEFRINGKPPLTGGPNLSVWKKYGDCWKMVNHSYVPPPPP